MSSYPFQKGFSLIEIMVALSLLGALSLGIMKLLNNANRVQSITQSRVEENEIVSQIRLALLKKDVCQATLVTPGVKVGDSFERIVNAPPAANVLFEKNHKYGNGFFQITDLKVINQTIPAAGGLGNAALRITFQRLRKNSGPETSSKDITLQVKAASPTGIIQECFADRENTIQTAKQEACESMGIWNSVNGTCDIKDAVKAAVVAERERFNALPLNAANVGQTNWVTGEKIIKNIEKRTYRTGNRADWCRSTQVYKCPEGYTQEGPCYAPASWTDIITCV